MRLITTVYIICVFSLCMICEAVSSFTLVNGMGNPITLVSKVFLVLVVKFELKGPCNFSQSLILLATKPCLKNFIN